MNFKHNLLSTAMLCAIAAPSISMAEIEVSGYIKNESAFFTSGGQTIGQATTTLDTTSNNNAGDLMKMENSARLFFNGDLGEESSWHAELNIIHDAEAIKNYETHSSYTQNDFLRELYVDTNLGDIALRIGKQQVVWGTADGIKLLDIINPTDYRELVQNTMEDSRIPIWMLNAEMDVGENGNFQFIVSQVEENKIPGLNPNGDQGQVFIAKGVDTITGKVNGFYNITPQLAAVATSFSGAAFNGGFDVTGDGVGDAQATGLAGFAGLTVDGFAGRNQRTNGLAGNAQVICAAQLPADPTCGFAAVVPGGAILDGIAQSTNNNVTNLTDTTYNSTNPDAAFEFMSRATFATFNTFSGNGITPSSTVEWVKDYPKNSSANSGFRFKNSTNSGFNYSLNYFNHYDTNPSINLSWRDAVTGTPLTTELATNGAYANGYFADPNGTGGGGVITANQVPTSVTLDGNGNATNGVSVLLKDAAGGYYGAYDPNINDAAVSLSANASNGTSLRFTEKLNRINSIGSSFDFSIDTDFSPIVFRGEFLYNKDELMPVVDKRLLAIGDLENALTTQKSDTFKYVLGADITVLTNMLVSAQFIQIRNLDYVNEQRTCTSQLGTTYDCSKYTGDLYTLSLTNGLNQAEKNKEFVSLFLSKPFGDSQEHRWNNIIMFEENGGFWNRFDVEYSFSDELIGSAELNMYWGDENTQFGQFKESSNLQLGIKYIFD